jgi:hypothetical protein
MSKLLMVVVGLLVWALPGTVQAETITFSFSGGTANAMFNVTNSGSPSTLNAINSFTGSLGTVTFTTGEWNDDAGSELEAFFPGGSISIASAQTLFQGLFTGPGAWTLLLYDSSTGAATFHFSSQVFGTLNPALLSLLGLPTNYTDAVGTINIFITFVNGGTTGAIVTGNLELTPVPEPGTMALLGSGLVGIAGIIRRRRKAAVTAARSVV